MLSSICFKLWLNLCFFTRGWETGSVTSTIKCSSPLKSICVHLISKKIITFFHSKSSSLLMTIQFFWCHFLYGCTFFVKPSQSSGKVEAKVSKVFCKVLLELPRPLIKCNILSKPYIVSTGIAEWPQVTFGNFLMQQFCQDEEKKWELVT